MRDLLGLYIKTKKMLQNYKDIIKNTNCSDMSDNKYLEFYSNSS